MGGGGKGKSVITVATAVFHAIKHATGWFAGSHHSFAAIWESINRIWVKLQVLWIKIKLLLEDKLQPILEKLEKLRNFYEEHIKPYIEKLEKLYSNFLKAYLAWKLLVERKLTTIFEIIENFLVPKVTWLDNALKHLQEIFSAFSKDIADKIGQMRKIIWRNTIEKIYETERKIVKYVHQVFVPLDKFVHSLQVFKRDHIDPLQRGLKGLEKDLQAVITKEKKPHPTFAFQSGNIYGRQMLEAWLGAFREWEIEVGPIEIEEVEIYETLKKQTADDPKKIPQEEKELYEIFEKRALMQ